MRGKLNLRQPAWEKEPTMIGDDTDPAPSSVQQAADTIEERVDLGIYLTNKEGIERMPQSVELTALGPTAPSPLTAIFD